MTGIYLSPDQADDLCELLDHVHTVAWWLLFARDEITDDLAQAAYPAHFHPRSAVFWLTEDLIHAGDRLHKAIHPDGNNDQPDRTNRHTPAAQAGTSTTAFSRDELDNSTPIGNQISQLRVARQATGSGPTGVPNGGYLKPSLSMPHLTRTCAALTFSLTVFTQ